MYCHKCGAANQTANAYCKSCGEWLRIINKTRNRFGDETPPQQLLVSLFMSVFSTLAALISAIALYITYIGSGDARWSVYLASAFCLCIAGWQASSFFTTLRLRKRLNSNRASAAAPAELTEPKSAPALNAADLSAFVEVTSVTENSTELLGHIRSRDTQR